MIYRIGPNELDTAAHRLTRDGAEVAVEPQVFQILQLLAEHPGEVITRDRLIAEVWQGRIVSEATIDSRIAAARKAVGDSGAAQAIIKTIPKVGLRLVADEPASAPAPAAQSLRFATSADGTRIAFATIGDGPFLLRGGHWLTHLDMDLDSPSFGPLLTRLATHFTVVRYDIRGTGLSDREAPPPTFDTLTEDLLAVADAAGMDRFPIYAPSQAAPVSVNFAYHHPDRVSRLILHGGYAVGRHHRDGPQARALEETHLTLIREGWGRSGTPFLQALSTLYLPDATAEQVAHLTEVQRGSASPEVVVALRKVIDRFDVSQLLPQITAPTLVLHATGESVQPFSEGQRLAAEIPGARFRALDSANHILLPQEAFWYSVVEEIIAFADDGNAMPRT